MGIDRDVADTAVTALFRCLRETDYIGWYLEGRMVGGVLTVLGQDSAVEVSGRIQQRLMNIIASGVTRQGEQSPPDQSLPTSRVGRDRVVSGNYEAPRSKLRGMLKFTVSISVRHLASLQYSQCRGTKTLCFCSKWSHSLVGKR